MEININRHMFDQLPGFIDIRDHSSKLVYANRNVSNIMGFESVEKALGTHYADMKCRASEQADIFDELDRQVLKVEKSILAFGLMCYHSENWLLVSCEKSKFINNNGLVEGVIACGVQFPKNKLVDLSRFIFEENKKIEKKQKLKQFSYTVHNDMCSEKLTSREMETLFFLLRGRSCKSISVILGISKRTVEQYVNQLKVKFKCLSKNMLIEKAVFKGYMNILPESLLVKPAL